MNKSTIHVLALFGLIGTLGLRGVMAQSPAHFTIPFNFAVGSKSLPAGDYRVGEVSQHVLKIQGDDGRSTLMVLANGDEPGKTPGKATMTFHRYGDSYFLSKVSDQGRGLALPRSGAEKELIARQVSSQPLDVIASSRK